MLSLFLRNLVFTILQPGTVVGLIPFLIAKKDFLLFMNKKFGFFQYSGIVFLSLGILITLYCIVEFATKGLGTLSPVDPTKKLVITGLYRYSRNPMYVGVLMCLFGEVLFTKSLYLLLYSLAAFVAFYLFVILKEEPRLLKYFGNDYKAYQKQVRRWI